MNEDLPYDEEPVNDRSLRFVERFDYRGHEVKIARRGRELSVLIYPPHAFLATRMVTGTIEDFQGPINAAKIAIDEMIATGESDK